MSVNVEEKEEETPKRAIINFFLQGSKEKFLLHEELENIKAILNLRLLLYLKKIQIVVATQSDVPQQKFICLNIAKIIL